eukprot:1936954-Lingulodinium_polyedra.AAC.1
MASGGSPASAGDTAHPFAALQREMRMLAATLDENIGSSSSAPTGGGAQSSETTRVSEAHSAAMKA